MTFGIFVIWVLMGVLGGLLGGLVMKRGGHSLKRDVVLGLTGSIGLSWLLRAVGIVWGSGLFVAVVVALIGAAGAILAQRMVRPTESHAATAEAWWRLGLGAVVAGIMGWMMFGPVPPPAATAAVIDEKIYAVTPPTMTLRAGVVTGEVTEMRVTERIEQGSNRVVSPAKLTARIALKNTSGSQSVRMVTGKIQYIDAQGQPITLEDNRADPIVKFASTDRLDPGQETTEGIDVEFPAAGLKANAVKSIRLNLAYVPSPYREETASFAVSIGEK